jgi:hypothetical protein
LVDNEGRVFVDFARRTADNNGIGGHKQKRQQKQNGKKDIRLSATKAVAKLEKGDVEKHYV